MTFVPGAPPTDPIGTRDAFHVAGVIAVSRYPLSPGQDIRLGYGNQAEPSDSDDRHGIVDPFLVGVIAPGTEFTVFLDPRVVEPIRHDFTIRGVPDTDPDYEYDDGCPGDCG